LHLRSRPAIIELSLSFLQTKINLATQRVDRPPRPETRCPYPWDAANRVGRARLSESYGRGRLLDTNLHNLDPADRSAPCLDSERPFFGPGVIHHVSEFGLADRRVTGDLSSHGVPGSSLPNSCRQGHESPCRHPTGRISRCILVMRITALPDSSYSLINH